MALYKRGNTWWVKISQNGRRLQQSTGTTDKVAAQRLHDKLKADLWTQNRLNEKPERTWMEAVTRYLSESQHKRSLEDDKTHLRWVSPYLKGYLLSQINRDSLDNIAKKKQKENVRPATVNRMLEVIRAILRKAEREWEWIDRAPVIRMMKEETIRIRWLTHEEAGRLMQELPKHLVPLVTFALATGLRHANVTGLQWQDVDLERRHALIHPDQAKTKKAIPVPLNETAMQVLLKQKGKHSQYVFTYFGKPVKQCNTKAWKNALARAGIKNFRWHDLRHTWASWHVQNGTSLGSTPNKGAL